MINIDKLHLRTHGYVHLESCDPEIATLEIASSIGTIQALPGIPRVQELKPRAGASVEASSYSGIYGMDAFPVHTDMAHWFIPPRFLLLRSMNTVVKVDTVVVAASQLFFKLPERMLRRALFIPRRRLDGALTIFRLHHQGIHRWDGVFLRPLNSEAKILQEMLSNEIADSKPTSFGLASPKECLLVDNWKALHGRSSIPFGAEDRVVHRVYLSRLHG